MTSEAGIPFLAVGNEELGAPVGTIVWCGKHKEEHEVRHSVAHGPDGVERPGLLSWVRCGTSSRIVAINGRLLDQGGE